MNEVTIVCLLVRGEYPFTPDYVRRLHKMVTRYCDRPFRFVCLTDQPREMPEGVEAIAVEKFQGCYALWTKLRAFDPAMCFTGRMLFLDLDVLIVQSLASIIDYPAAFALTEDALVKERAHLDTWKGRKLVRKFNSSVMVWNGGEQSHLFTNWTPDVAKRLSTDQDWIAEQAPDAQAMPLAWWPRISQAQPPWEPDVKVVLVKKPKCHLWAEREAWFESAWGGW